MVWRASVFVVLWTLLAAYRQAAEWDESFLSPATAFAWSGVAVASIALTYAKQAVFGSDGRPGQFHNDLNWIAFVVATLLLVSLGIPNLDSSEWD